MGMRHCPGDGEAKPASITWEFRQVEASAPYITQAHSYFDTYENSPYFFLSGWVHLPPSLWKMCDSLPHSRGPLRRPDAPMHPRRQKPAVEVWVVEGRLWGKVKGNLKWPFTIFGAITTVDVSFASNPWVCTILKMGMTSRYKSGGKVTLSQWITLYRAIIPVWISKEEQQTAAEWEKENCKERFIWSFNRGQLKWRLFTLTLL